MFTADEPLRAILKTYRDNFANKSFGKAESDTSDILMDVFGINADTKRENRQYWGRELGTCWERLVKAVFTATIPDVLPGYKLGKKEICDLVAEPHAIDMKYRLATSQPAVRDELERHAEWLVAANYVPVLLVLRDDNLPAAVRRCETGGWTVHTGAAAFDFIKGRTHIDLNAWLTKLGDAYFAARSPSRFETSPVFEVSCLAKQSALVTAPVFEVSCVSNQSALATALSEVPAYLACDPCFSLGA